MAGKNQKNRKGDAKAATREPAGADDQHRAPKLKKKEYEARMAELQIELVKMQYWVKQQGLKVVMIFEGRDAAGKGGTIKRLTEPLNPRGAGVVALPAPSDRERTQWYFQRYVTHLPAAGEIVIFDRSWYNRGGVERVMGFCTEEEYRDWLRSTPEFERMLVRSGIVLLKYWFSVSDAEQEARFQARAADPLKRWKLSPMDFKSREKWVDFSKAKDEMFSYTDIREAPWYTIEADDKKSARLNCISHVLDRIPYQDALPGPIELPERPPNTENYQRPPKDQHIVVEDRFWERAEFASEKVPDEPAGQPG
ncbi:MAG: polyphosphate kinase 2 [Actinomycetota bacterium]|nr:polyphosphate kinase 2 [Actinomycetota bacterium]